MTCIRWRSTDVRRLVAWMAGVGLAFVVLGLALQPLTSPVAVRSLVSRYSLVAEAGLPKDRILSIAEEVRGFAVCGMPAALPATVDGRSGFDAEMVSHLVDVRDVLTSERLMTGILAALIAIWFAVHAFRRRFEGIASTMNAAALACVLLVAVAAAAALTNFDVFFTAFHQVFFSEGNWSFPADSLLIQIFPEAFWAAAGGLWAALTLLGSAVLALFARLVRGLWRRRERLLQAGE